MKMWCGPPGRWLVIGNMGHSSLTEMSPVGCPASGFHQVNFGVELELIRVPLFFKVAHIYPNQFLLHSCAFD